MTLTELVLQSPLKFFYLISLVLKSLYFESQWFSVAFTENKVLTTNKQTNPTLRFSARETCRAKRFGENQWGQRKTVANKWPPNLQENFTHTQGESMYLGFLPVQMQDSWFIFGYHKWNGPRFQIRWRWIFKRVQVFVNFRKQSSDPRS